MILTALGDSIVKGFGVGEENSFVFLEDENIEVENYGINGATSFDVINNLNHINGEIVLIYFGINDFLSGFSVNKVFENMKLITSFIKELNKEIVICSIHKLSSTAIEGWCESEAFISTNRKIEEYNVLLKKFVTLKNFKYLDINKFLLNIEGDYDDLFFDGIHPTKKTHALMRRELLRILR